MLANSAKIWHVNKRYFLQLYSLAVISKHDKGAVVHISTVFGPFTMLLIYGSSET